MQNSVQAGASEITVTIHEVGGRLDVAVTDNGSGMDEATRDRALDPFFTDGVKHPERRVGLGLPFLRQMVETTEGSFSLESEPGTGTAIRFGIPAGHVDAPPIGALPEALQQIMCFAGDYEMVVDRRRGADRYTVRRSELADVLGELETVGSQQLMQEYIRSLEGDGSNMEAV